MLNAAAAGEMAFNLVALLHPIMRKVLDYRAVFADFGGGFAKVPEFHRVISKVADLEGSTMILNVPDRCALSLWLRRRSCAL